MSLPKIVSQEEWTVARRLLLEKEKDLTRQRDRLNTERRELPMVEVTKPYEFEDLDGMRSLLDLFEGRPQLIGYHFMFHPDWEEGCPSCSAGTDELAPGLIEHLDTRDTTYAVVSRARWPSSSGGGPRRAGRSRGTPRSDRARAPGGLGAARWPYRQRPGQPARLRVLTIRPTRRLGPDRWPRVPRPCSHG